MPIHNRSFESEKAMGMDESRSGNAVADEIGHLLTLARRERDAAVQAKDQTTRNSCNNMAERYMRQARALAKGVSSRHRGDEREAVIWH